MTDVVTSERLIGIVKRYPTWQMLFACQRLSLKEEEQPNKPWRLERVVDRGGMPQHQYIYVTQFMLALLAKTSIVFSSDNRRHGLSDSRLFDLIGYAGMLDEPFLHHDDNLFSAWSFLVRTAWWQFPLQTGNRYVLPRYYSMFRLINDGISNRRFDVPSELKNLTGATLEELMAWGLILFAQCRAGGFFSAETFRSSEVAQTFDLTTNNKVMTVFDMAGADYQSFRELQSQYESDDLLYMQTEFNALFRKPLIFGDGRGWIAPVPRMILERFTMGLFYDLADQYRERRQNDFLDFFGDLFEYYIGRLLEEGWGTDRVQHEPRYGSPELRGPDWIVKQDDCVLLFECKGGRLRLPSKTVATEEDMRADIGRMFVDPIAKYPAKIEDLKSGATGLDLRNVRKFYPCVVVPEYIYMDIVYRTLIDDELQRRGIAPFEYYLIDINTIEIFSGLASSSIIPVLLDEWETERRQGPPIEFAIWLQRKVTERSLSLDCPFLAGVMDSFFQTQFHSRMGSSQ
jgi:hypothetical protein